MTEGTEETAVAVRERPILFSAEMVRAILDGRKTQTRRTRGLEMFNAEPDEWKVMRHLNTVEPHVDGRMVDFPGATPGSWLALKNPAGIADMAYQPFSCPFGVPGDRLWVREAIRFTGATAIGDVSEYEADGALTKADGWPWKRNRLAPMFCPRGLSRITLEITDVRVQRVQDISEDDAVAEGVEPVVVMGTHRTYTNYAAGLPAHVFARDSFRSLWDKLNVPRGYGWDANPWVWAITFKRVEVQS